MFNVGYMCFESACHDGLMQAVLDDMIPLCPSCHKSVHLFYKIKLTEWGVNDFGSKKMAKDVYEMAKGTICL